MSNDRKCPQSEMNHLYHTSAKPQTDSTSHFCNERKRGKFWVKWLCYCNCLIHWQVKLDGLLVGKWSYTCRHNLIFIRYVVALCISLNLPELISKAVNNLTVVFHQQEWPTPPGAHLYLSLTWWPPPYCWLPKMALFSTLKLLCRQSLHHILCM